MSFPSTAATLAAAETAKVRELPMPPWAFAALAFAFFVVLLGVLWSFRNTAAKYDKPDTGSHGPGSATDHGAKH
jgi:hypothetical protein